MGYQRSSNRNFELNDSDRLQQRHGTSVEYVDIDFPIVIRNAAANRPIVATLQGNLTAPQWAVDDYVVCEGEELIHGWEEGTEVSWHIHIYATGDGTDSFVNWEVEYTWANINSAIPANTTVTSGDFTIPASSPLTLYIVPIDVFTPSGGLIAAHVKPRLKRIASTGAAPSADPFCEILQLHVKCDTLGSRNISSK